MVETIMEIGNISSDYKKPSPGVGKPKKQTNLYVYKGFKYVSEPAIKYKDNMMYTTAKVELSFLDKKTDKNIIRKGNLYEDPYEEFIRINNLNGIANVRLDLKQFRSSMVYCRVDRVGSEYHLINLEK
jgi:hypothetical protein